MRVLCVDTALAVCQAAVVDVDVGADGNGAQGKQQGEALAGLSQAPAAGDAEAIADHVARAMDTAGAAPNDIARVVVTVGPGSFTGVRVGLAYAKGFAAGLGIPVMGVSTLEGLARTFGGPALSVVNARHGAVYAASLGSGFVLATVVKEPAAAAMERAVRDGLPVVGPADAVAELASAEVVASIDLACLAAVAREEPAARPASARYVAGVDAAPQRHKSLARA